MYIKQFNQWNEVKKAVDIHDSQTSIRAGEIRWVSFGVNVGSEIDGKGSSFTRPAVILHVIGSHLALVAPMSTKVKDVAGYIPFSWNYTMNALCIHQIRTISQKRILSRKGKISDSRLKYIKSQISSFFHIS